MRALCFTLAVTFCAAGSKAAEINATAAIPGLVSRWSAEESPVDSVGSNHGETMGGVEYAPRKSGAAFSFNGKTSRLNISDSDSLRITDSFSIEGWIFIKSMEAWQGMVFFRGDDRSGNDPYSVMTRDNGTLCFDIDNEGDARRCSLQVPVGTNRWIHFASVYDQSGGRMNLYLDGLLMATEETTYRPIGDLDPTANPAVGIGNHPGTYWRFPFHGLIDELSLYSRALTVEEVRARYNVGAVAILRAKVVELSATARVGKQGNTSKVDIRSDFISIEILKEGNVRLRFLGAQDRTHTLQVSTDLTTWSKLGSASYIGEGFFEYVDAAAEDSLLRYYRILTP